ncbi:MAG: nucleotidyltransferase family protein [Chthoniobacterales bacterium]
MTAEGGEFRDCDKFYRASMRLLEQAGIPFLVGGAYAFGSYTGISRDTKDFDIFVQSRDVEQALAALDKGGYRADRTFPHWLAKAHCGENVIDLIYRAGNGLCEVDQSWFDRACDGELLEIPVKLCAPEEILWMKAFIMERERYDGADVAHLIESCAEKIDWEHLLQRFAADWRLLLSHLILFGYVFPSERDRVPARVMGELLDRLGNDSGPESGRVCRGTMISRQQYLRDVQERGFIDARLEDRVRMNQDDIARWTEAISRDGSPTH